MGRAGMTSNRHFLCRYGMRSWAFLTFFSFSILTGFVFPAHGAAEDYLDLSPEQLLSIEAISASKRLEKVSDIPAAVYVLSSDDIARSGATTIPDALRMVPGVNVAQIDGNTTAVSIRGFNSFFANKLLVMIDGRTIYNPMFGGVIWDAHDLMMEDIDRIEVVRGPGGTLWGANAVNGVINIITKSSADTQGNLLSGIYGDNEKTTGSARHGGALANGGTYRIYAKSFNRDSSPKPGGGRAFDAWEGMRSGFRADWGEKFTLSGDVYRNKVDQLRTDFALVAPLSTVRNQKMVYDGANILARWNDQRDDGSLLSIQSYLDWARRDEPYNFVDSRVTYDLDVQYNLKPLGLHEVIVGGGYRFLADHEKGNANTFFRPEGRRQSLYNVFAQDKITLMPDKWYLTLGSKFEHNPYSGFETEPTARLQWYPAPHQSAWASVSRAVRMPTPLERDVVATLATAPGVRFAIVGNPEFDPESLKAYELGYRNEIASNLSIDTAAFYNDYDNLARLSIGPLTTIDNGFDPVHPLLPFFFENGMEGKTYGAEVAASWSVTPAFKLTGSYSYLRVLLEGGDATQQAYEDTYPFNQINLRASWDFAENWTLDTSAYYVDALRSDDIDSYLRLDVNLGWQLTDDLKFNLVGQNLIGGDHRELGSETDLNAAEVDRGVYGKLTWRF